MMTLDHILNELDKLPEGSGKVEILTCGATHIAQDKSGEVYAYHGEPRNDRLYDEWLCGNGELDRCVLWCGDLPAPEDWKDCIWELP